MKKLREKKDKKVDGFFIAIILIIMGINLVVMSSASANIIPEEPYYYVIRQGMWMLGSLLVFIFVALFDYHHFRKIYYGFYFVSLMLLVGVLFAPAHKGAHRWFDLGFMLFQPSELAKVIIIIVFACFLVSLQGRHKGAEAHDSDSFIPKINRWYNLLLAMVFMVLPAALIVIEPDFGTAIVFMLIFLTMIWIGGLSTKIMGVILTFGVMLIFILFLALSNVTEGFSHALEEGDLPSWVPLKPYQITRLIIFINPYMDPLDAGYQMIQSEVAIGSGGLWGKGYGEGTQVQGNFLPDHHTDFIFSVIGEEFGFVGTITIMLLYLLLLLRCLYAAISARDQLGRLIASGVTAMFACQIFINIGMTIGIMPVTGITFPLLSYGGSSMMINMIALGLVFSVYARRFV